MAKRKPDLQKIVSLKRQKAEQDFRTAQQELERAGSEARRLTESLQGMDGQTGDLDASLLAFQNGHVRKLIQDIDASRSLVSDRESDLREAHDLLKRAFDSEDRLKRAKK